MSGSASSASGLMGHGMAKNIVEKGYPLSVIAHRNREPVDDLVGRGATEAASLARLAAASDIVFLCLTGSPEVEAAVGGLAPGLARGAVVVDCSTSDPVSTARLAERLAEAGRRFRRRAAEPDAEGGMGGHARHHGRARATPVFARIRPVVDTWAGKVVHIGGVGDGHRMKLLNNFLSLGYAAIYAEALAMAGKVGIPVERFDSVIRGGRMDCGFYQTFMGYALEGNREAHRFTLRNAYKDLKYLESMANDATVADAARQRGEEQLRTRHGYRRRRTRGLRAAPGRFRPSRQRPVSRQALFRTGRWWVMTGSNRRHPRCKRDALPTELITHARLIPHAPTRPQGAKHPEARRSVGRNSLAPRRGMVARRVNAARFL